MKKVYGYFNDGIWQFQREEYIEDGWIIKMQNNEFVVYEIPQFGGEEQWIASCSSFDAAYDIAINLT